MCGYVHMSAVAFGGQNLLELVVSDLIQPGNSEPLYNQHVPVSLVSSLY